MAYYSLDDQKNVILQIQRILRDLDYRDTSSAKVRMSGIYDTETKEAVRSFQKKYDLPATGVVDYSTWQVLQAVDKAQKEAYALARAVYILPRDEDYTIYPDTKNDVLYVIQYMLNIIGQEYDDIGPIEFTGIYDKSTQNAIKSFQRKNLLDDDGIISPSTFNYLANEYERINSINQ